MHPQNSVGILYDPVPMQPSYNDIVLAQVIGVSPDDHAVQVVFNTMAGIFNSAANNPLKVKVLQQRAGLHGAVLGLPQVGEWGLVCFPNGSDQIAVWLGALNRDLSNLAWDGVGPLTRLDQHESGVYRLIDDVGNVDEVFADGSRLRVGAGTAKAARLKHERQGQARRNADFVNPQGAPATVFFQHIAGTTVQIDPNGDVTVTGVGNVTVQGAANVTVQGGANVMVQGGANVTVQGGALTTVEGGGPDMTLLGNVGAYDYVVLLAGLANLIAWATNHIHDGVQGGNSQSGPPTAPPNVPTPGVDFTINSKAT